MKAEEGDTAGGSVLIKYSSAAGHNAAAASCKRQQAGKQRRVPEDQTAACFLQFM